MIKTNINFHFERVVYNEFKKIVLNFENFAAHLGLSRQWWIQEFGAQDKDIETTL